MIKRIFALGCLIGGGVMIGFMLTTPDPFPLWWSLLIVVMIGCGVLFTDGGPNEN